MLNSNLACTAVSTNLTPDSSSGLFLLPLLPCLLVSQGLPWGPLYFSTHAGSRDEMEQPGTKSVIPQQFIQSLMGCSTRSCVLSTLVQWARNTLCGELLRFPLMSFKSISRQSCWY